MSILEDHLHSKSPKRVLICAQSNAAVDKLCSLALKRFPPTDERNLVVRSGDEGRFDASVRGASLGTLARSASQNDKIESQIGQALSQLKNGHVGEDVFRHRVEKLKAELRDARLDRSAQDQRSANILRRASYVFSTLGSAGSERLRRSSFDLVVVHGANAACEARTLLALYHARRYVLFGDHRQLQPVVSEANKWTGYNRSFYERLADNGFPLLVLNTQNEYHPWVYRQVSRKVYNGKVEDGSSEEVLPLWQWQLRAPVLYPNTVVSVSGEESAVGTSYKNEVEIEAVLDVLQVIISSSQKDPVAVREGFRIAVLSPYGAQVAALENATNRLHLPEFVKIR